VEIAGEIQTVHWIPQYFPMHVLHLGLHGVHYMTACIIMQEDDSTSQIPWMHCHTHPVSTESPLVDSPLHPKTELKHAELASTDVECDMIYFLDCHTSFHLTVTLTLVMQLTHISTFLMKS
jgi:hypothetical protein